ncbi:MAG TPA: hypothetical protein VHR45_13450 [Thermoanaerobaculia bacterium]|nr:hypothetical protein [Thermoanaerobaculia bacterium]
MPAPLHALADALCLGLLLAAWGAQAVVPWRIAGAAHGAGGRRRWALLGPALVLPGALAGYLLMARHPDAAIAAKLVPLTASVAGTLVAVLAPGLLAVTLVAAYAGDRLEVAGWRIVAAFGAAVVVAASWAEELLRTGEGPPSPPLLLALLAGCRVLLALAAGELAAPGRPAWSIAAGCALPSYLPLLPPELRLPLWHQGEVVTLGAAALLLVSARWLPPALRRVALAAGVLLAALALSRAADLSESLAPGPTTEPLPPLPAPR